jgi:hypothetical protein
VDDGCVKQNLRGTGGYIFSSCDFAPWAFIEEQLRCTVYLIAGAYDDDETEGGDGVLAATRMRT